MAITTSAHRDVGSCLGQAPATVTSPGIMGWYAWMPVMECYHGVVSFSQDLSGSLSLDGGRLTFDGGRGYLEKDWGRAFPTGYIWMQSNHFTRPGACLVASVAVIPWRRTQFRGFIVGFRVDQSRSRKVRAG